MDILKAQSLLFLWYNISRGEVIEIDNFRIEDLSGCSWALRKIKELQEKKQETIELADVEINRINAWKGKELESIEGSMSHFQALLHDFINRQRQENEKFTISTPYGKAWTRKTKGKIKYDEKKMIEYLETNEHDNLIRMKKEVNKKDLSNVLKVIDGKVIDSTTGEAIDFIKAEPDREDLVLKI